MIKLLNILIVSSVVLSCSNNEDKIELNEEMLMSLEEVSSGYEHSLADWKAFIKCWKRRQESVKSGDRNAPFFTLDMSAEQIVSAEKLKLRLSMLYEKKLSNSVKDFYSTYINLGGEFINPDDLSNIGVFSPENIQTLKKHSPDLIEIDREWAFESPDQEYFVYGIEQDTSSGRFSNFSNSVVIGRHGFSEYELILAYTNSRTADGEHEVAITSHAYEFRTTSFAEMMRQISMLDSEQFELMPPYKQEDLKGTCAEEIKLKNVFWK